MCVRVSVCVRARACVRVRVWACLSVCVCVCLCTRACMLSFPVTEQCDGACLEPTSGPRRPRLLTLFCQESASSSLDRLASSKMAILALNSASSADFGRERRRWFKVGHGHVDLQYIPR